MKTDRIINQYLWLTGIFNFGTAFSLGTYVTFLLSRGLNLFEVNLINIVFFTTMFFFEVPTGAFADTFGRKKSYVISCFLFSIGELVYSQSYTIAGFICAEILAGVGKTFANGAYHAWFVDTLKFHGHQGSTESLFKKEQTVRQVSSIPAAILGGYIGSWNLGYPWIIGGVIGIVAGCISFFTMKEEYFVAKKINMRQAFIKMFSIGKSGFKFAWHTKQIRFAIIMSGILAFAMQGPNMQWQPFFKEGLGSTAWYGFLWLGVSVATLIGTRMSTRIVNYVGSPQKALILCYVVIGAALIGSVLTQNVLALSLTLFILHEAPRGSFGPIKDALINDAVRPEERATVISCQSMFSHAACLVGLFVSGIIANNFSIGASWGLSALVLFVAALLLR